MITALLCIDFIHEIIDTNGKLAAKGYAAFAERHGTLQCLADLQQIVRASGGKVIHVHLGFSPDYTDHPQQSRLLGGASAAGILQSGTTSTAFYHAVAPLDGDVIIEKKRISAFFGTELESILRSFDIQEVLIAGVATDIAVQSAARDAHDRDFIVKVAANACAAASDQDHTSALENISKFAEIV